MHEVNRCMVSACTMHIHIAHEHTCYCIILHHALCMSFIQLYTLPSLVQHELIILILYNKVSLVDCRVYIIIFLIVQADGGTSSWLLQECPRLKDAYDLIESHSAKWNELGRKLNVSHDFRRTLRNDPKLSDEDRLEEILQKWIESDSEDAPATWSFLIEALKGIELRSVITDIEEFLKTPKAANLMASFLCNLVQNVFS